MELPFGNKNLQTTYVSLGDINGDVRRRGLYDIPARPLLALKGRGGGEGGVQ